MIERQKMTMLVAAAFTFCLFSPFFSLIHPTRSAFTITWITLVGEILSQFLRSIIDSFHIWSMPCQPLTSGSLLSFHRCLSEHDPLLFCCRIPLSKSSDPRPSRGKWHISIEIILLFRLPVVPLSRAIKNEAIALLYGSLSHKKAVSAKVRLSID